MVHDPNGKGFKKRQRKFAIQQEKANKEWEIQKARMIAAGQIKAASGWAAAENAIWADCIGITPKVTATESWDFGRTTSAPQKTVKEMAGELIDAKLAGWPWSGVPAKLRTLVSFLCCLNLSSFKGPRDCHFPSEDFEDQVCSRRRSS